MTFSRTGFLGLIAMFAVLVWKLGRDNRAATILAAALAFGTLMAAAPGGYGDRLSTITDIASDPTGSAQMRRELLKRAVIVAIYHPIVGVGMGNYHIYSLDELVAHNAYLETAAELGLLGFAAYLVLHVAPFRSLRRIEREVLERRRSAGSGPGEAERDRDVYYLCMALQASLVAYMVCSFFASIQYQWLLYYIVAHAVAVRRIHAADRLADAAPVSDEAPAAADRGRGVLWRPSQRTAGTLVAQPRLSRARYE
jgi:O-antigen ligase